MKPNLSVVAFILATLQLSDAMDLPKISHPMRTSPPVFLLCIDNAGRWGFATAKILHRLEHEIHKGLSEYEQLHPKSPLAICFTSMAGIGSGGLLAAMLTAKYPGDRGGEQKYSTQDLVSVFKKHGNTIFPEELAVTKIAAGGKIKTSIKKYKASTQEIFSDLFGEEKFTHASSNLYIPVFNMSWEKPDHFSNSATQDLTRYRNRDLPLKDVISAATAPFYPGFFYKIKSDYDCSTSYTEDIISKSYSLPAFAELTKNYPKSKKYIIISLGVNVQDNSIDKTTPPKISMENIAAASQKCQDTLFHEFLTMESNPENSLLEYHRIEAQVSRKRQIETTKKDKTHSKTTKKDPWHSNYDIRIPKKEINIGVDILFDRLSSLGYWVNKNYLTKRRVFPKFLILTHLEGRKNDPIPKEIIYSVCRYLCYLPPKIQ